MRLTRRSAASHRHRSSSSRGAAHWHTSCSCHCHYDSGYDQPRLAERGKAARAVRCRQHCCASVSCPAVAARSSEANGCDGRAALANHCSVCRCGSVTSSCSGEGEGRGGCTRPGSGSGSGSGSVQRSGSEEASRALLHCRQAAPVSLPCCRATFLLSFSSLFLLLLSQPAAACCPASRLQLAVSRLQPAALAVDAAAEGGGRGAANAATGGC